MNTHRAVYLREPYAPSSTIPRWHPPAHLLSGVPARAPQSKFNVGRSARPLRLESIAAHRVLLVSNPRYYRGRPYVDRLEFILYQDDAAVFEERRRGRSPGSPELPTWRTSARTGT